MPRVAISSPLRHLCGQRDSLVGKGTTLLEIVTDAVQAYPDLRRRVLRAEGGIHPQVLVYVDGAVLASGRDSAEVNPDSTISLLQIVGGG